MMFSDNILHMQTYFVLVIYGVFYHANWYVPIMVSQCQTKKKLWAGHESRQTEWFPYTSLNFVHEGYSYQINSANSLSLIFY